MRQYVTKDEDCILERNPLVRLARDRELHMYKHRGFWACMDTQRERDQLNQLWSSGEAPWIHPCGIPAEQHGTPACKS